MAHREANFRYTLQRTMIVYFLLIGFAALLLGVEFVTETYSGELRVAWLSNIEKIAGHAISPQNVFQPLEHLRFKAVLMIFIIMLVVVIVLMMFIKNITGPLQHMIEKSNAISQGDLSQTIQIDANNELADLGGVINEMSSNLQEIIHFSLNTSVSGRELISEITGLITPDSPSPQTLLAARERLAELDNKLVTLKSIVDCFKFYSINEDADE